jgi:hypothetical protein
VTLLTNAELGALTLSGKDTDVTIELNKKTLTFTNQDGITVTGGAALTIQNGTLADADGVFQDTQAIITVETGSEVTLDAVTSNTCGAMLFPWGEDATVIVKDSNITADAFCVTTNANDKKNYNVNITLTDSTFSGLSPVLVNVPCTLKMTGCTVNGEMHGVVVRGGTADISGCTITQTYKDSDYNTMANYFHSRDWGSGNTLQLGALIVGNKGADAYQYPSEVTVTDSTIQTAGDYASYFPAIYTYANSGEGDGVKLTVGGSMTVVTGAVTKGNEANHTIEITGGRFSADPSGYVASGCGVGSDGAGQYIVKSATAYEASVNDDKGTKYLTLIDAIDAAEEGQTVTLLDDVNCYEEYGYGSSDVYYVWNLAKDTTLDLNGHTISARNFSVVFTGIGCTIKNGNFVALDNGSYGLFIGDEGTTRGFTVENVAVTGGINVYNTEDAVVLRNVTADASATNSKYYAVWCDSDAIVTIESGTYTSSGAAVLGLYRDNPVYPGQMNIIGGNFIAKNGASLVLSDDDDDTYGVPAIQGGTFSSDPGEYCADGYVSKYTDEGNYVVAARDTSATAETDIKPIDAEPLETKDITIADGASVPSDKVADVKEAAATVTMKTEETAKENENIKNAVDTLTAKDVKDATDGLLKTVNAGKGKSEQLTSDDVVFYTKTTMSVKPTEYTETKDSESGDVNGGTLVMDIEPIVEIYVSTAKTAKEFNENTDASVMVGKKAVDTTDDNVQVTVTLTDVFKNQNVFISHKKDDGTKYIYTAKANGNGEITFNNPHGFSTFTFSTADSDVVAYSGSNYYATLQQAVDAANGGTITVSKSDTAAVAVNQAVTILASGVSINVSPAPGYQMVSDGTHYYFTAASTSSATPVTPSPEPSDPGNTEEPSTPSDPGNTEEPSTPSDPGNTEEPIGPTGPFQSAGDEGKLDTGEVTVVLKSYTIKETGKEVKPVVYVYTATGAKLKENADYTVTYNDDHKTAGEKSLTVTLKSGNYVFKDSGVTSTEVDYQIVGKSDGPILTAKNVSVTYGATKADIQKKANPTLKQGSKKVSAEFTWSLDELDEVLGAGVYPVTVTATYNGVDVEATILVTVKAAKVSPKAAKIDGFTVSGGLDQQVLEEKIAKYVADNTKGLNEGDFTIEVEPSAIPTVNKAKTYKVEYKIKLTDEAQQNVTFSGKTEKAMKASVKVTK